MAVGRKRLGLERTLIVHAVGAPAIFLLLGLLAGVLRPDLSPLATAAVFLATVVAFDALIVAPFMERSYAMFRSALGTWIPFGLIFVAGWAGATLSRL